LKAVILICAILEAASPLFFTPKEDDKAAGTTIRGILDREGDHLTVLNVFHAWEEAGGSRQWCVENYVQFRTLVKAKEIAEQLGDICEQIGIEAEENECLENTHECPACLDFSQIRHIWLKMDCIIQLGIQYRWKYIQARVSEDWILLHFACSMSWS
jgi:HrpA-like RNA helicase